MNSPSLSREKLVAVISSFPFLFFVPLVTQTKTDLTLFYAKQSLVLLLAMIIALVFLALLGKLIFWGSLVICLYRGVQAFSGKKWSIPFLGQFTDTIISKLGIAQFFTI